MYLLPASHPLHERTWCVLNPTLPLPPSHPTHAHTRTHFPCIRLAYWTSRSLPGSLDDVFKKRGDQFYLSGLAIISAAAVSLMVFRGYAMAVASTHASVKLHTGLLNSILRAPMTFFDSVPGVWLCNWLQPLADLTDLTGLAGLAPLTAAFTCACVLCVTRPPCALQLVCL